MPAFPLAGTWMDPIPNERKSLMKRLTTILAALSMAAVAGPLKVGANVDLGLSHPLVGSDLKGVDGSVGFGASIGPVVEYAVTPLVGVQAGVSYAFQTWSVKSTEYDYDPTTGDETSSKVTSDFTQHNLEFSIGPNFHINDKINAGLGYRWTMPLAGTVDQGGESSDIQWAGDKSSDSKVDLMSTHSIYLQGGYEVIPHLTVGLDVVIGLTGWDPKINDDGKIDGAESSSKNISSNRYALNVRYDFL